MPRPPGAHINSSKWIFRHKHRPDGTLEQYKARWVVRGFTQRRGVDYTDTFSLVIKPASIRIVLQLGAARGWPVHQLDVKNAFLHGDLVEHVYCKQPAGFVDVDRPRDVCLLSKSLYGLKQAPQAWFTKFTGCLRHLGFQATRSDASLFVLRHATDTAYLLLYVDDIILAASSDGLLPHRPPVHATVALKDLGPLWFFLSIQVQRSSTGFLLHQAQYAAELL